MMRTKKILCMLLFFCMTLMVTMPVHATGVEPKSAAAESWNGVAATSFAGGTGTEADPFLIENAAQLAYINASANYPNAYFYKIVADLDFGGNKWTPIGSGGNGFAGTLDGDGHKMLNFKYDSADTSVYNYALFYSIDVGGTVKNISFQDIHVASNSMGRFAAVAIYNYGTISNCHVESGEISAKSSGMADCVVAGITCFSLGKVLNCSNSATISGDIHAAGIVGGLPKDSNKITSTDSPTIIQGCVNNGTIKYTYGGIASGGILGSYSISWDAEIPYPTLWIDKCVNNGAVEGMNAAGISGTVCCTTSSIISNCYNTGKIGIDIANDNIWIHSHCGIARVTLNVKNCFNVGEIADAYYESGIGNVSSMVTENCYILEGKGGFDSRYDTTTKIVSEDEMKSGAIAFALNQNVSAGDVVWGQDLREGTTDSYPSFLVEEGNRVYQNKQYDCDGVTELEPVYSNKEATVVKKHTLSYSSGKEADCDESGYGACWICSVCEKRFTDETAQTECKDDIIPALGHQYDANGICQHNAAHIQPANFTESNDVKTYQISNAGNLAWFAQLVNEGTWDGVAKDKYANAVVTADIDMSAVCYPASAGKEAKNWTPIGGYNSINYRYYGIFDGQNHNISNLYFYNTNPGNSEAGGGDYVGLFGYISTGSAIRNVNMVNVDLTGNTMVGAIAGKNYNQKKTTGGKAYIENCTATGKVKATASSGCKAGGIVGQAMSPVENCYSLVAVTGTTYVGGVTGWNYTPGYVKNCYSYGTVTGTGTTGVGGVVGYRQASDAYTYNSYYLSGSVSVNGEVQDIGIGNVATVSTNNEAYAKTADEFASGKVAYLLNANMGGIWGQTLKQDNYPVFALNDSSKTVYEVTYSVAYEGTDYANVGGSVILPSDPAKEYSFKVDGEKWDGTNITSDVVVTVTIKLKDISIDEEQQTYPYNGDVHGFIVSGVDEAVGDFEVSYKVNDTYTTEEPVNAGKYDVKITRAADAVFEAYEKEIPEGLVVSRAENGITDAAISDINIGESLEPTATAAYGEVQYQYYTNDGEQYQLLSEVPAAAGTYYMKAIVYENDNFKGAESEYIEFHIIGDISIDEAQQKYDYNGTALEFEIRGINKDAGGFAVGYKVNGVYVMEAPVNVGVYDVKISREGDAVYHAYEKEITGGLTIEQAANAVTGAAIADIFTGETLTPTATVAFGTVQYQYYTKESGEYQLLGVTPTAAGIYYMKASVEETTDYAGAESDYISFKIKTIAATVTIGTSTEKYETLVQAVISANAATGGATIAVPNGTIITEAVILGEKTKLEAQGSLTVDTTGSITGGTLGGSIVNNGTISDVNVESGSTISGLGTTSDITYAITEIAVTALPVKKAYESGEPFAPEGLVITVQYEQGNPNNIAYDDMTKGEFSFDKTKLIYGDKKVVVTYKEKTAEIAVTVVCTKHDWSDWKVTKAATYDTAGEETRTCSICNEKETRAIAKLTRKNLSGATVSGIVNKGYTGKAQTQSAKVKIGTTTLKNGTDYKITYSNNTNIGKATITFTGKGGYTGTLKKTFNITVSKGKTYLAGNLKYYMTNAATNGSGTVSVVGTTTAKTALKSLTIANTVRIGGKTFKITDIGNGAFQGFTKLQKVTLGSNITTIGSKAFYGDKALKSIVLKSNVLKSVKSQAIKNIYKKATIKVPSSKVKAYTKLFKGSTGFKSSMKIKK